MKDIIIKIKEDVNMEFTHEEMLMKIKEGRDLAKNAMELADV